MREKVHYDVTVHREDFQEDQIQQIMGEWYLSLVKEQIKEWDNQKQIQFIEELKKRLKQE